MNIIKFILILNIVFGSNVLSGELDYPGSPENWLSSKDKIVSEKNSIFLEVCPIILTSMHRAIKILQDESFVKLQSEDEVYYMRGAHCQDKENKGKLYLVRGLYNNISGNMNANWYPDLKHIQVSYGSLGKARSLMYSPIIVRVPDELMSLSVIVGGAM